VLPRRVGNSAPLSMFRGATCFSLLGRGIAQRATLAAFGEWTRRFAQHVDSKGTVGGADDAASGGESATQCEAADAPKRTEIVSTELLEGNQRFRVERRKGSWLDTPSPRPTTSKAR
jgi:hypothetical protein